MKEIKMAKKQSIKDLYKDERVKSSVISSVLYGRDEILSRATQYEDPWMIEHIMSVFQEKISPFYDKKDGYDLPGFWEEISELFNYEFDELEKHCLKDSPHPVGEVNFMRKLYRGHMDKFYAGPTDFNHTMNNLISMVNDIDNQVINEERGK